jgi:hypothetical protein
VDAGRAGVRSAVRNASWSGFRVSSFIKASVVAGFGRVMVQVVLSMVMRWGFVSVSRGVKSSSVC